MADPVRPAKGLIPQLGAAGAYSLLAPFQTDLLEGANYVCVAIRKLKEVVAGGGDPFADFYVPKSIDSSKYQADVAADVCLISLQADDASIVHVPSSYIAAYPDGGGLPYRVMLLSIPLGAVPDSLDLSPLAIKIQDDIKDMIGVTKTVRVISASPMTLVSYEDAASLEAARKANIGSSDTDYAQLQRALADLATAHTKIQQLETYIATQQGLQPPDPPPIEGDGGTT